MPFLKIGGNAVFFEHLLIKNTAINSDVNNKILLSKNKNSITNYISNSKLLPFLHFFLGGEGETMKLTREKFNFYEQFLVAVINEISVLEMNSVLIKEVKLELLKMLAVRDKYCNTNHVSTIMELYGKFFEMNLKEHSKRIGFSTKTLERYRQIYVKEFYTIISKIVKKIS